MKTENFQGKKGTSHTGNANLTERQVYQINHVAKV